jgi:hypothetical protein
MSFLNESDIEARLNSIRDRFNFGSTNQSHNFGGSYGQHDEPRHTNFFDNTWKPKFNYRHGENSDSEDDSDTESNAKSKTRGYTSTYTWSQMNGGKPTVNRTFKKHGPAKKSTSKSSAKPTTKPTPTKTSGKKPSTTRERTHPQFKAESYARPSTSSTGKKAKSTSNASDLDSRLKALKQKIADLRNRQY